MAKKFYGAVGYGLSVETSRGVWEDVVEERMYFGDVLRTSRGIEEAGSKVNFDITLNNSLSIVADAYALSHYHAIRYVEMDGARWVVSTVTVERPRLILRLDGVYNGPTPSAPSES